jgi:hypothetical protein
MESDRHVYSLRYCGGLVQWYYQGMNLEHFGGGDEKGVDRHIVDIPAGQEMPGTYEIPAELPEKRKFPEGIENWPDIGQLGEDDPLPGEDDTPRPPARH